MQYQKLDPRVISAWRIGRFITWGVCLLVYIAAAIICGLSAAPGSVWPFFVYGGLAIIALFHGLCAYYIPLVLYNHWGYLIRDDRLELHHGLLFISTTVIPMIRVQHITVSHGPIYRKFNLSKIVVSLASGSFEIEGLASDEAITISHRLKDKLYLRLESEDEQ